MDQIELKAANREILGKKVRFLRRQGITPANIFGHGIESVAIQCDAANLRHVLAEAGYTRLINLKLGKERRPRTVMIREVQIEPRTLATLHVDFYQVRLEETVRVEVPVVLVGEAPVLRFRENMLEQELNTLHIEALPAEIPADIEVDISSLAEPDDVIRVRDIELAGSITILNDPDIVIVKITSRHVERVEEAAAAVEAPEAPTVGEEESKEE